MMKCCLCNSPRTTLLKGRTAQGYRRFQCKDCSTRFNEITMLFPTEQRLEDCVGSCDVETGRLLGAEWIITGEVLRFGPDLRAILSLHHVPSGALQRTERVAATNLVGLEEQILGQTLRLLSSIDKVILRQLSR